MFRFDTREKFFHLTTAILTGILSFFLFAHPVWADQTGTLLPAADGVYKEWTPKSGQTHYSMVDETTCNGLVDYNFTNTLGRRDSYPVNLASIPNGATLTQISLTPCAAKNGNGGVSSKLNLFYRLNGVNSQTLGNYSLTATTPVTLTATNFTGLSNIKSSLTTLEIGAVYSSGNKGVRLSRIAAVVTYTPLAVPLNLTSSVSETATVSAVSLSWTDTSSNEDGFRVERSTDGVNFTQIASVGKNAIFYTDANLLQGTYYYRIRAYNSGGSSAYSNTATATLTLLAPTDLTAVASTNSASLNWVDNSAIEQGFAVERSTDGVNFTTVQLTGANATSYFETGLDFGTYDYRVRAFNSAGDSLYSNTATVVVSLDEAQARDVQREVDLNSILDGVYAYAADNNGNLPPEITFTPTHIGTAPGLVNLSLYLVPTYMQFIPKDPAIGTDADTQYTIYRDGDQVTASAVAETQPGYIIITR